MTRDYRKTLKKQKKNSLLEFFRKLKTISFGKSKRSTPNTRLKKSKSSKQSAEKVQPNFLLVWLAGFFTSLENLVYRSPLSTIKVFFGTLFLIIVIHFVQLQVYSNSLNSDQESIQNLISNARIIPAKRGQIHIRDLTTSQSSDRYFIPLTSTQTQSIISYNPSKTKQAIDSGYTYQGKELTIDMVAEFLASNFNLSYEAILDNLEKSLDREDLPKYTRIQQAITDDFNEIRYHLYSNPKTRSLAYAIELNVEEQEVRYYPKNNLLAATLGYVSNFKGTQDDAIRSGCKTLVDENLARQTVDPTGYTIGNFGLEQEFCYELSGLNGRRALSLELNNGLEDELDVKNGSDIYLTIDMNLQEKAEEICQKYYERNTNSNGSPKDCGAVVMNSKTGEILAMASYPSFNPNEYNTENPANFKNVVTSVDYEVGSIMKPLTVAAALNENKAGNLNSRGGVLGVDRNYTCQDYPSRGKPYTDNSGKIEYIQNADNRSFANLGQISLSDILKLSINTCISDIVDTLGNVVFREYLANKFMFGKDTQFSLPGDTNGLTRNFDSQINFQFSYAQMGFGQGYTSTMIQFLRAFSAIANGTGEAIEPMPYLYMKDYQGQVVKTDAQEQTLIPQKYPVLDSEVASLTRDLMVQAVDSSRAGSGLGNAKVSGYQIFAKSGTGQIATADCSYLCHSRRGLVNQSCVGGVKNFDNPITVMVKMGQPFPGQTQDNFAGTYTCPAFQELMEYSLRYLQIPKNV